MRRGGGARLRAPRRAVAGGGEEFGTVLGACDGGEAAGGGAVQLGASLVPLLRPVEDGADAPAGARARGTHLALPAVEGALFLRGPDPGADGVPLVLGPQPPGPGLEGVAHDGRQLGVARRVGREAGEHGNGEPAESGVVVAQGQLVQGPGPVRAGRRVAPEQEQGVLASVGGEVPQDGEREPGPGLLGVEVVLGAEEVRLDLVETAVEVQVETGVVEGAVLDLPVVAGVGENAVVEGREGLGPWRGERVQGAVAAAPLQQAEQGAARRYDWIEHGRRLTSSCRHDRGDRDDPGQAIHLCTPRPCGNMSGRSSSFACQ